MTISARDFLEPALMRGYDFWTGVPCSFLTPLINTIIQDRRIDYIGAASEGEAVGIAAGAYLAGRKTVVICQNSGLGNTINPLTSLNAPFRIPTLLITTHRGAPDISDEPQHEVMGIVTGRLLRTIRIPWEPFPSHARRVAAALDRAEAWMESKSQPFAFVMKKGTVEPCALKSRGRSRVKPAPRPSGSFRRPASARMKRVEALRLIRETLGSTYALVATTGKTGRELFTLGHRSNQLYIVGSMGCASAVALGIHQGLRNSSRRIAVIDGDGAALMKMGSIATIGHERPRRLLHLILDNEVHDSTGGQATVSTTVDFAAVARACGYRRLWRTDTPRRLATILREAARCEGPALVHVKITPGSEPGLPRPTVKPHQVKEQFQRMLAGRGTR